VSADGSVIVGTCDGSVVSWTNGAFANLGFPIQKKSQDSTFYRSPKVSDDGSTIVGWDLFFLDQNAFYSNKQAGFSIAIEPSDAPGCLFYGVSADGSLAVGTCGFMTPEGVYWDKTNGIQVLSGTTAFNNQGYRSGGASAISAGGTFIAGSSAAYDPTRWDAQRMPHSVETLIPASLTAGWRMAGNALALSSDGLTIVGTSTDPTMQSRSWIIRTDN
jgi:hypothetical protein